MSAHDQSAWNLLREERDELAQQVEAMRAVIKDCTGYDFPANSANCDILRQRDARTLREAADRLESYEFITNKPCSNYAEANELRLMADELEANRG